MRNHYHRFARRGRLGTGKATRREFLTLLPALIVLPSNGLRIRADTPVAGVAAPNKPRQRPVFVVDDCEPLTSMYRLCLESAGYEVRVFLDRAEALRAFMAAQPCPALLITDYDGYSMSAEEFMAACRQVQPDLPILMASGYPTESLTFRAVQPDAFLPKPFRLEQLLEQVKVLTRGAPGPARNFPQGS